MNVYRENKHDNLQKEVNDNYTLSASDNNFHIWLNKATAFNVTVNNNLPSNFECYFYNIGVGDVVFVSGTGTIKTPDGTILKTDKVCTLVKKSNTNNHIIKGELSL
ncbi:hypothetical protein [Wocania ichthyoenteri]|uniref:hypothetical protein n=1 Tax=Wocania ichthyoenteri TaxID=1230531 RepID=UPI00053D7AD1|nr:hypothetical protein [Wocania ichthyoenteri]